MGRIGKEKRVQQVILGARGYSIGAVLFHQAVGQVLGVNVTDVKCLDIMTLKGAASPSQLADLTGLTSGSTTAMIDRLEGNGLVERRPHPTDRRSTVIVLTKVAARRLPPLFESLATAMHTLVSSYSANELDVLADFFTRVTELWERERVHLQSRFGEKAAAGRRSFKRVREREASA
jgi:DNA-binding MarR family transcriptional regulator